MNQKIKVGDKVKIVSLKFLGYQDRIMYSKRSQTVIKSQAYKIVNVYPHDYYRVKSNDYAWIVKGSHISK